MMALLTTTLVQSAVEYGAAAARSAGGTGGTSGRSIADQFVSQWNAVVPFPPWVAGVGVAVIWMLMRGRRSGSGVGFGDLLVLAFVLGAAYLFGRANGLL